MKKALKNQEPKQQKAFRNKYLAAMFAVAALLISSIASAQSDELKYSKINGYGFVYKRWGADSILMIPPSTSPHTPFRAGAIRYKAADSTLQLWTGYQWNSIQTGIGNGVDTMYMLNDTTLTVETPNENFFVIIPGRHSRFGIDDILGVQDRNMNMQGHDFTIDSAGNMNLIGTAAGITGQLTLSNIARLFSYDNVDVHSISVLPTYIGINGSASNSPPKIWIQASDSLHTQAPNSFVVMQNDTIKVVAVDSVASIIGGASPTGPAGGALTGTYPNPSIADDSITTTKFRQSVALSVMGNPSNATDYPIDIAAGNDGNVLCRFGTSLGFGAINLASNNAVTGILPLGHIDTSSTNHIITQSDLNDAIGIQHIQRVLTIGNVDTNRTFQFGYPQAGFVQSQQNSPTDTTWTGEPILVYPFRGSDTAIYNPRLLRLFQVTTHRYDVSQPPNVIIPIMKFGEEAVGKPYVRVGALEENWNDNYEYHPVEMKVLSSGSAVRMQSVTMNRTTGLSTWTHRATQHIFSDLVENQMLSLNLGQSTLTAQGTGVPVLNFITNSTDGTHGGLTMATHDNQTLYNWHPSSGSFHTNIWDLPYATLMGSARNTNSDDAEIEIVGAGRTANNRIFMLRNGSRKLDVWRVTSTGLHNRTIGGEYLDNSMLTLRVNRPEGQKPFSVYITNADTIVKAPFITDTVGRVGINIPAANTASFQPDPLPRDEQFQVYGESYFSDTITAQIMDSTSGPTNMAWRDPISKQLKLAAAPSRIIDALITTSQNTGTGETDLYSKTIAANTLTADKQTLNFEADGEFNDNTATAQLKLYFGGNVTLNTGAINISTANTAWRLRGYIIRTSSTTAHLTYELQCPGLATPLFIGYSNLTSLDFTTTNIIKITAQAGGGGGGTGDITAHSWQVLYRPQP